MTRINVEKQTMEIKTAHGTLIVQAFDDKYYPGLNIDFRLDGHENEPALPICMIEDAAECAESYETNGKAVVTRVYRNCNDDEYTHRIDIPIEEIKEFLKENK